MHPTIASESVLQVKEFAGKTFFPTSKRINHVAPSYAAFRVISGPDIT